MSIRYTTGVFATLVLCVFSFASYIISKSVIVDGFEAIENEQAVTDSLRAVNALNGVINYLDRLLVDWAYWDDSYAFVQDRNEGFIKSNLTVETLIKQNVAFVIFLDNDGGMIWGMQVDADRRVFTGLSPDMRLSIIRPTPLMLDDQQKDVSKGILILDGSPFILSSRRILDSDATKPPQGVCIMGRRLDHALTEELGNSTQLNLNIRLLTQEEGDAVSRLQATDGPSLIKDETSIFAGTIIRNLYGTPSLELVVKDDRSVMAMGLATFKHNFFWMLTTGISVGAVFTILLEVRILRRIRIIRAQADRICQSGETTRKIVIDGKDEISGLANNINHMLAKIDADEAFLRQALDSLQASERRFSELIRYSFDSITILDKEGVQVFVSDAVERMLGYKPSELIGIPVIKEMLHPDDQEKVLATFGTILREGMGGGQYRHKHKNGSWVYLEALGTNQLENPDIRGVVVNVRDITDRKLAEQALQVSEAQFKSIVESSPMGMHFYRLDDNNKLILVAANPASDRLLNIDHSKLFGMFLEDAFPGLMETEFPEMFKKVALGEIDMQTFEMSYHDEIISGIYEVYVFKTGDRAAATLYVDISDRKKIQELMIQTEKMMSVGGLAAGMAHEINNPLSGIMQNVQVMMQRLTTEIQANLRAAEEAGCSFEAIKCFMEKRGILSSLESVRQASLRAAHIVASMLEFSRKSTSNHIPVNINALLDKALDLCSTDYDLKKRYDFRSIKTVRCYEPFLPLVSCIETQIQQVFMNLLTNAAQAMADTPSPTISLRTFTEGGWVCIEIEDNGPGMTEEVSKHVFEPFYTTKPVGEGTGLGLSVSYFIIVNHHNGTINVDSVLGRGAKFIIRLPISTNQSKKV